MAGRHKWIACLYLASFIIAVCSALYASAAEFSLSYSLSTINSSSIGASLGISETRQNHQNIAIASSPDIVGSFARFSNLPSIRGGQPKPMPVIINVAASSIQLQPGYFSTLLDISSPSSEDLADESFLRIFDSGFYYQLHGNINAETALPVAMDISAIMDCTCLDSDIRHIALAGEIFWRSRTEQIQIGLVSEDSSMPLQLSMKFVSINSLKSPFVIANGNAILTDDTQILDFNGSVVIGFSQQADCVHCLEGVFAGLTTQFPENQYLLVALKNR
jgi:hypothetical protein